MKNRFFPLFLRLCLGLCAAVWMPALHAEKADRDKPVNFEADALESDNIKQISKLKGNVIITKGSIVIRAAAVELRQDSDGYHFAIITGSADAPAFFRQKREGVDEFFEGESHNMEYDGRAETVKLTGHAVLRRLRGATLADETLGDAITYNNSTDTVTVNGKLGSKPGKAGAVATPGRIRGMLTPQPSSTKPSSSPATNTPAANLRPSSSLGSEPK